MKKIIALIVAAVMCFSMSAVVMAEEAPTMDWFINPDFENEMLPEESVVAFNAALEGLVGVNYVPIATLGLGGVTQDGAVVSYLAKATAVVPDAVPYLAIVSIFYNDTTQEATLINIEALDLGAYAYPSADEDDVQAPATQYDAYMAAAIDDEVTVQVYVMDHQGWWDEKVTVYACDENGGYFIYNMACSEEDAEKLTTGTKIEVTGYKAEWSGEIEIVDATFTFVEGAEPYIPELVDVSDLLGTDELINYMNQAVDFGMLTVAPSTDADGNEVAFLYNWDGSGEDGNDLYFNVEKDGNVYQFTVESYLYGPGTEVYEDVKNLSIGDVADFQGFLYWYNGPNPHIGKVTK